MSDGPTVYIRTILLSFVIYVTMLLMQDIGNFLTFLVYTTHVCNQGKLLPW